MELNDHRPALVRSLVIDGVVLAVIVGVGMLARSAAWTSVDDALVRMVDAEHSRLLDRVALALNTGFGPALAAAVAVVVACAVGLWRRSALAAVYVVALTGAPWVCAEIVKLIVRRIRPDPSLLTHPLIAEPATFSYPSGHTAFAFAVALAVVATLGHRAVTVGWIIAVVVGLVTAWSRVYVGAHYPTDVVASLVLVPAVSQMTRLVVVVVMPPPIVSRLHDRRWSLTPPATVGESPERVDF